MVPLAVGDDVADRSLSRPALKFASGELVFGYRLIRMLGRGSFGEVWLASNDKGFEWALKIVSLTGSGGKKEFRALQLIKDRKIKSTHLLKLIDYGLLDRDGTSLAVNPATEAAPRAVPEPPQTPMRGTLVPQEAISPAARTYIEQLAARDTQQNQEAGQHDLTDLHDRAAWLIIVMEVGDRTLHEMQLEETRRQFAQRASRATHIAHQSGTVVPAGSKDPKKASAQTSTQADETEEPLAPLPVAKILTYIDQAARGLDYLHRHDILHRDVKPQNIMLIDADAKLCDYGLASEFRNASATTEGCSPAYAAPEAINNRPVPASDQYSLAVTYVELVTGRWPFFGTTQTAIYREKDEGRHNLTFIRNRRTRQVLARALAKHPEDRYPTCTQFAHELAVAEHAPQRSLVGPALKWLTALCALALVAGTAFLFRDEIRDRISDLFKRPPEPPIAEIIIDPVTTLSLPPQHVNKLATTPTSFSSVESSSHPRAVERPQTSIGSLQLLRTVGDEPPPRFEQIVYVSSSRWPVRQPQALAARSVTPVPPLPKYVYRNADEELTALWTSQVNAPDDFLPRFAELIGKSQRTAEWWRQLGQRADEQPSWLAACERQLLKWLPDSSEASRALRGLAGFDVFALQIKNLGAGRMLAAQLQPPIDVGKLTRSNSFVLNQDRPLALWLRTDWELMGKIPSEAWLTDRLRELSGLPADEESASPADWQAFQHYVLLQLHSQRTASDAQEAALSESSALLAAEALPAWLGPPRKQVLSRCLARVTIANMNADSRDVLRWSALNEVATPQLLTLNQRVKHHALDGPESATLNALTLAVTADSPDWRKVSEQAQIALASAETTQLLKKHDRLHLMEYVAARAQLQGATNGNEGANAAIGRFAALLESPSAGGQRFFNYASDAEIQDQAVLQTLIQPVLDNPTAEKIAPNTPPAASLAALWGAKGRILQRKPQATPDDLLHAHEAFARARELDARSPRQADYLVGYCTTFAPRIVLSLSHLPRDHQLISLVKELPDNWKAQKSDAAKVALLQAHVLRMEGDPAAAASQYEAALANLRGPDPYHLQESALLNLCYAQLELARLAPWREADLMATDLLASPIPGTKSHFLSEALRSAQAAEKLTSSLQREQVYLAKGAALEHVAREFSLPARYAEAAAAYQQALAEAQSAQRSTAACRLNLGRCYVTAFADPALAGTSEATKATRLRQAITELSAGLDEKVGLDLDEAKRTCDLAAYYWRGQARAELARMEEQSASLPAEATRDFRDAIRLGKSVNGPEVGAAFLALLRAAKPASGTHDAGSMLAAKALLNECLAMLQEEPRNFAPEALQEIIEENRLPATATVHSPAIVPFIQWFSASWPIAEPWTQNDAWRVAGARLASLASTSNANDPFRKAANDLAFSIQDPARKNLALSYQQHKQLSLQVKAFVTQQSRPASSVAGGNAIPSGTPAGGAGSAQLEVIFQRYFDSVQQAVDPVTRANLARLNRLPTEKLAAEFQQLPPLQQRLMRQHLTRDVTFEDRLRVWELIGSAQSEGNNNSGSGASTRLQQIAHDLLKPMQLLTVGDLADKQVEVRLRGLQAGIKAAEEKLGIRPKEEEKPKAPAASTATK